MEVSKPTLNTRGQSYTFQIICKEPEACGLRAVGPPSPTLEDLSGVISLFVKAAADHFPSAIEIDDLHNTWNTPHDDEDYSDTIEALWIPKAIQVSPIRTDIDWVIHSIGRNLVPADKNPGRAAIHRRRVREARLRAAAAKLHAEKLAEAYFMKYGPNLLSEAESSLSD